MAIARKAAAKKPAAKKAAVKKVAAKKPAAKKARAVKKKPRLTIGERIMKLEQDAEKQLKQMANALEKRAKADLRKAIARFEDKWLKERKKANSKRLVAVKKRHVTKLKAVKKKATAKRKPAARRARKTAAAPAASS
ncbi:MAG: hypothetical protein IPJ33_14010 [Gammaproteobacteria bacterium]|nr:hypothetical protein [Gammaproteobacteria bacterium]MBP6053463.1 hypothetical protein [Pseudomonadales bacterium]MBK7729561.1 hypothetical protein [Gammaproteobacteria bacterium]MBK8308662.1 hypothetical protein [Gammaproteobacteria bacterium]MBK9667085.1 hypothetical protein [Gammaproteobacteria bacterium]